MGLIPVPKKPDAKVGCRVDGLSIGFHPALADSQHQPAAHDALEVEEDLKRLNAGLAKNPDDPEANAQLALIYLKRNNLEKGLPFAEKATSLDSENKTGLLPELHINLGLYYGNHIDAENAEE